MELKTKNLVLRTVTHDDIDEVARMWNFEKGEISLDEAEKAINWMNENHKKNKLYNIFHLCFAVFEENSNKIIGWCGLDGRNNSDNNINIFYLIDKDYRKRGYATECAEKLLEYGFLKMRVTRIDGKCSKENIGSKKILQKIGMNNQIVEEDGSHHYFITFEDYIILTKE